MRIKSLHDISKLGTNAKQQIEAALKAQGGFNNQKRPNSVADLERPSPRTSRKNKHDSTSPATAKPDIKKKKAKPARVMRTHEGLTYCPWPSTDPFVKLHQRLEARYGRFDDGGLLVTEMIVAGGEKQWRFDLCLVPKLTDKIGERWVGNACVLIESDGFGFHRSLDAFKNDRRKQSHALTQGCVVKRVSTEDVNQRLDEVLAEIDLIASHQRLYPHRYTLTRKGKTQSVFEWGGRK